MNLRAAIAPLIEAVHPSTIGTVYVSTGYTTSDDGDRTPTYRIIRNVKMDVQALTEKDIHQVNGLNVAGSTHTVYLFGRLDGLVRPENKGGDLIEFNKRKWLVTGLLEDWPTWCKVAITLQNDK